MKHTPGPWEVQYYPTHSHYPHSVVSASGKLPIAEMPVLYPSFYDASSENSKVAKADALLIAAAPELLEALKELVRVVELDPRLSESYPLAQARAAIKKARGE